MSRTIIDVLVEIGHTVELSSLEETRGIFMPNSIITLNGKLFDGIGVDVSGSVFYRCALATDAINGALLMHCNTNLKVIVPKDLRVTCDSAKVSLKYVDFLKSDMQGVDLQGANLQGANLQGANLQGAKLGFANLQDADLRDADQRDADLRRASYSRYTLGLLEEHKSVMNYCWDDEDYDEYDDEDEY